MIKEDQIYKKSNVYLAYLRVKNTIQNEEMIFNQEIAYFENDLVKNLESIQDHLKKKDYDFQKFDFIVKFKKIKNKKEINYRPLVRFRFYDLVLMQSVFNIVCQTLKNFLPKENYGVQLAEENSPYLYENWIIQYKKFTNEQKENLSENTIYQYSYEYDISQFYPSIQQNNLINQLKECLKLTEDNLIYYWIEKIIKYFNEQNVSLETKDIFEEYFRDIETNLVQKQDLGLPQGPLYSAFLASFYTRELFDEIRKSVKENWDMDCEILAYVDDGRIYFKDYIIEDDSIKKGITTIVKEALKKLNNNNINEKIIELNEEKSCLISIDEKSIASKLNYLTIESSLINNSINPNFDIEQDTVDAVLQKHENIRKSINDMYDELKDKEKNESMQIIKSEINKLKKTYSTYTKRNASFITRKISSNEKFYELVNEIFATYECNSKELDSNLCDLNYYYALCNMLKNAGEDSYKIEYLCNQIEKMLKSYENLINNNCTYMLYYYMTTIKAIHTVNYTKRLETLIDLCLKKIKNNTLLYKCKYSYNNETWFFHNQLTDVEIDNIFDANDTENSINEFYKDTEIEAIIYYLKNPFAILNKQSKLFNPYIIKFNIKDISNIITKKYCSLNKLNNRWDYDIVIHNNYHLEKGIKYYMKLDNISMDIHKKIKILNHLIYYWKDEKKFNNYIKPSYLILDNIYIKDKEIHIINNMSDFFMEYELYKFGISYKKYFIDFFMKLFNCEDNIIINKKGKSLKFWEYRILAYLQNRGFDLNEFLDMLTDLLERYDYFNHDVDINYERIRKIVDNKLKTVFDKDVIIQLHYFVQCIWKNGSRDLTFYTLHNQEHSVELIQNYLNINKRLLSKLSLTKNETFILFSACYLHDIGMLKGLTDKEKYDIYNSKIINYYNNAMKYAQISSAIKIENALNKFYEINNLTNNLIEDIVRGEHAIRSSVEIQNDHNLPLSDLEKKYVAEVSLNHMKDTDDVYGLQNKKLFRKRQIDIRKISMWLRLLDLTDITKYRVTQEVFDRYFDRMGVISRFHWVKHLCVDDLLINVEQEKMSDFGISLGDIIVTIKVMMNYIPPNEKIHRKCEKCCKCEKFYYDGISYKRNKEIEKEKYCDLQCAFFNEFKYFDQELDAINNYAKLYQEGIKFKIEYVLNEETKRKDFIVLTNYYEKDITATECIRLYFNRI